MAQYTTISSGSPLEISGNTVDFQYWVDDTVTTTTTTTTASSTTSTTTSEAVPSDDLNLRQTITGTGFAGVEDTDWGIIKIIVDSGYGEWRVGVRDAHWVVDCAINAVGFGGVEDTDWENVEQHKLT